MNDSAEFTETVVCEAEYGDDPKCEVIEIQATTHAKVTGIIGDLRDIVDDQFELSLILECPRCGGYVSVGGQWVNKPEPCGCGLYWSCPSRKELRIVVHGSGTLSVEPKETLCVAALVAKSETAVVHLSLASEGPTTLCGKPAVLRFDGRTEWITAGWRNQRRQCDQCRRSRCWDRD